MCFVVFFFEMYIRQLLTFSSVFKQQEVLKVFFSLESTWRPMIRCFKDRSLQELTLDKDRAAPQAPALRRGQRKVQPRAVRKTIPQDLTPRKAPLAPPPISEEVPAKLTTTFTLDVLQPFMRTSMENYYICTN